jgi:hypothetical protein
MESNLDKIDRIIEGRINMNSRKKTNIKNSIPILSDSYQALIMHLYTIQHYGWENVPHTTLTIGSLTALKPFEL